MSEAELQRAITDACDILHLPWFHIRRSERNPGEGFPDLVVANWRSETVQFMELKSAKGRLRPMQIEWMEALRQCHRTDVQLIRPNDLDWVLARLNGDDDA